MLSDLTAKKKGRGQRILKSEENGEKAQEKRWGEVA